MQEKKRHRQTQIARVLYESQDVEQIIQLKELLNIKLEDCKDKLVSCPLEVVRAYQGEAKAYESLLELIERQHAIRE